MANNYIYPSSTPPGAQNNMNTIGNSLQQIQQMIQPQTQQQFFLQPQGSLFMINNPLEVSNVPVGVGLSAAISLSEGLLYLKTMQNGVPMVVGYKLSSLENIPTQSAQKDKEIKQTNFKEQDVLTRLEKIENFLSSQVKEGGEKLQWQV